LAIDFPVARNELTLLKDGRDFTVYDTQQGFTQCLGKREHGGYVKLYDKTKESKLVETLTRLEITMDGATFSGLPTVVLAPRQLIGCQGLNDTQHAVVQMLNTFPVSEQQRYLKMMGRGFVKTIKPYVMGQDVLDYDLNTISMLLYDIKNLQYGRVPLQEEYSETENLSLPFK
jgi:hypothetical protein